MIATTKFDTIMSQQKNSLFVKNLAVAIFGTEVLRQSSLTGKSSNRYKGRAASKPLDVEKLQALHGNHYSNVSNALNLSFKISIFFRYIKASFFITHTLRGSPS